jgi:hypothetical protein
LENNDILDSVKATLPADPFFGPKFMTKNDDQQLTTMGYTISNAIFLSDGLIF